ncbi:MAG: AAA family ATPase, partial [Pseudomonadota bacterium]|nr:AAA family ATPase [Pseudomonadota bacterium]
LETICEELKLAIDAKRGSIKALVDTLNTYLLDAYAQGLRVVLIIDEAQNLSAEALEQVRLLTNLETDTQKLLQIILLGQPELRTMLARPELRQLAQRITARYHLDPLDPGETAHYLRHRYRVAGGQHFPFDARAVQRIHTHAGGVPRLINVIAERALLAGYARDLTLLDAGVVDQAAREALAPAARPSLKRAHLFAAGGALLVLTAIMLWPRAKEPAASTPAPRAALTIAPASKPIRNSVSPTLDGVAFVQRLRVTRDNAAPAWHGLLALWQPGKQNDAMRTAFCAPMPTPGLYCVRGVARLDKLAMLGRPALLRLRIDGRDVWALLTGADAVQVRLRLDDTTFDVDRIALEQWWRGDYAAVWRGPAFLAPPIVTTTEGAARHWIRQRLEARGSESDLGLDTSDIQMRTAVREFQRAHALGADGMVGPETLMALAGDEPGPRLARTLQ